MDPLHTYLIITALAALFGFYLGWRLRSRSIRKLVGDMENESSARALELLETRQHLRKISGHLKQNLKKDRLIRQLRRKQKLLQMEIDRQVMHRQQQEKSHYIETAKIKSQLLKARMQATPAQTVNRSSVIGEIDKKPNAGAPSRLTRDQIDVKNTNLRSLLEQAGLQQAGSVADLSKHDITQLSNRIKKKSAQ